MTFITWPIIFTDYIADITSDGMQQMSSSIADITSDGMQQMSSRHSCEIHRSFNWYWIL